MLNQYVIANWKMNGTFVSMQTLLGELSTASTEYKPNGERIIICPPYPYLQFVQNRLLELGWQLGAQNCSDQREGAFTGQVSAGILKDIGCRYVIVGHSESRLYNNETNALIAKKVQQCLEMNLTAILCVGETLEQYNNHQTHDVITTQLKEALPNHSDGLLMIAYEPIWSIGTGKVAANSNIIDVHQHIKDILNEYYGEKHIPVLYGGSVNAINAVDILKLQHVDGVLVGGASLKAQDFLQIIATL